MANYQREQSNNRVRLLNLSPGSVEKKKTKLDISLPSNQSQAVQKDTKEGACDVCSNVKPELKFYHKVSEIKNVTQDESEVLKFIYSELKVDIHLLCPSHYKLAFKKFVGLNKVCSNPLNKENHQSKSRLTVLKIEMLADIKR